ncbi:hypothetical protein I1A62_37030 [Rhodococcus sp. USK10]|uniref:hypothetical protein n=1 Tax=Rhodococcus sp. USK10 TaxID=2789739 RepID=UPI001C5D01D7|nr:hypothetical protein [Rhodococcus sp. USK10]QYB02739.1 hypothetical protein I1A62_37030 [Rhodococcus sp. USK10]
MTENDSPDFSAKKVTSYSQDELADHYARLGDRAAKLMRLETNYRDQGEAAERSGDISAALDFRGLRAEARSMLESVAKNRAAVQVEHDLRNLD